MNQSTISNSSWGYPKYQIGMAGWFLYQIGVSYHETGTLKEGNVKLFDYYKVDSITHEQRAKLKGWCKDIEFKVAVPQYAPEQRKPIICFPKAAFYRKNRG